MMNKPIISVAVGFGLSLGLSLSSQAGNGLPPRVWAVDPPPGTISELLAITVTFSEPVTNVVVTDLLINGQALALAVTGSEAVYTFTFAQQPPYGLLEITWDPGHDIRDLDDIPSNRMDENDPANRWSYRLVDLRAPTVAQLVPAAGTTVRQLSQIEVRFSEPVAGVDAADLLINGQPATNLVVRGVGRYLFQFAPPAPGPVQVQWAEDHGITDFASPANEFEGGAWTYTLDPLAGLPLVRLNEFLAANVTGLKDEDGESSDWIELWNYGSTTVNLGGFALTDDPDDPTKWTFPPTNLGPGQFLVVFASGKDRRVVTNAAHRFHTNFRLNRFGNYLALFNNESPPVALTEFAPQYPEQRNDHSYGYDSAHALRYFATPTPGAANPPSDITNVAPKPKVSVERGIFSQPFTLIASVPMPGLTLRYTTDGSEPTATTGQVYSGPLQISNTTVFRVAAFGPGMLPSRTETHTYLFVDQVLHQPNNPPGYPAGPTVFSGYPSDYEMDPEIVTNAPAAVRASLLALPVLSIAIKIDDMFGATNGIYTHPEPPAAQRYLWERPCSVEFILTNGQTAFQVDCGIRIQGNASRTPVKTPKHPFRLFFRGDYGPGELEYQVFPDAPRKRFNSLVLRADFNNSWVHWDPGQRLRGTKVRDAWTKYSFRDMNGLSGHTRHFHLYINGLYWGVYDFGERIDADFAANYLGGTRDQYDAIATKPLEAIDGDLTAYNAMVSVGRNADMRQLTNYNRIQQLLDMTNFIDYTILNFYGANRDWGFDNNWNAIRRRSPDGKFQFVPWDGEQLVVDVNDNRVANTDVPAGLHTNLVNSPEYRLAFADRVHKHLFNNGALTPENCAARWMYWAREVEPGMLAESARWGDYRRDVHQYQTGPYYLYTTNDHWWPEILRVLTNYFPQRHAVFLQQLRSAGLYPSLDAPVFSQHGGRVARGFALSMSGPGPIYYTTDGTDPRVYGTGAIAPTARLYTAGQPVILTGSTVVKARTLSGTNWSALTEASFVVESLVPQLRITEIMYNPIGGDSYEFIELQNFSDTALDVSQFSFSGITFVFPVMSILAPGQVIVLASGNAPGNWTNRYPGVAVYGWFSGSLANGGERLALKDAAGRLIYSVTYDDDSPWPTAADGLGYSLEIIDPLADPNDPANWRASAQPNGTPGTISPAPPPPLVQINELMADNRTAVSNAGTFPDWVELYNPSPGPVDLSGWSLSDGADPRRFVFPAGTSIPAGGYLVVWCDTATNLPGLHTGFALDNDGEAVFLYNSATVRVDAVSFGLQIADLSLGRLADGWGLCHPTPGAANLPVTNLAAPTNLVLNEWLANPPPGEDDWIELYNGSTDAPVALRGLYLSVTNAFSQIMALSFLPPGGFALLRADEQPGPTHLDFRLSAEGGTISLYDPAGNLLDRVSYGPQLETVSEGRLPDGSSTIVSFPGTASPRAPNYRRVYTGPLLNEVMAINHRAVTNALGVTPDWIELVNTNEFDFDLTGFRLSTDPAEPAQWVFPAGVVVPAGGYLVVWFDEDRPPSYVAEPVLNTGRQLRGETGSVLLFDAAGLPADSVVYGFQVPDMSIGRYEGTWQLLAAPTPGGPNAAPAALAAPTALRINEWMANPLVGDDWFELFNKADQPVALSGLYLSDDPSSIGLTKFQIGPLSYIGPRGFVKVIADDQPSRGLDHVNFALDAVGEALLIYSPEYGLIDAVYFGAQAPDVSEGRLPDGASYITRFPTTPTPAASNYQPLPQAVINEVLSYPTGPREQAIEIYNPTSSGIDISGWYLSTSPTNFKQFRIPDGTLLLGGGYVVFYQWQWGDRMSLDPYRGGAVYVSEADAAGNLSGRRTQVNFGPAMPGTAFGRWQSCVGVEFVAMSAPSFGPEPPGSLAEFRTGTGRPNPYPAVGPVVINELMYHPPDIDGQDNTRDEYIELHNAATDPVYLFDPANPQNTWRLRGGVRFEFPPGLILPPGGFLLVVNFNPADPAAAAAFRGLYGVPSDVVLIGPYQGRLANDGERIELQRPLAPVNGEVPYALVDAVHYSDSPPWPVGADGDGASLQRLSALEFGNDPVNWIPAGPTAGRANVQRPVQPPVWVEGPVSRVVPEGSEVIFAVATCGNRPRAYQWFFNADPIAEATNAWLRLPAVQAADAGQYWAVVGNAAGWFTSPTGTLAVLAPPVITAQPQGQTVFVGGSAWFQVSAVGPPPLSYQWRLNGAPIPGATNATLVLTNVQLDQAGDYTVLVSNPVGTVASAAAQLVVPVPPRLLSQPQSQTVYPGTTVSFSVTAQGTGQLRYQWLFNGEPIPGATAATLVLTNVQLAHCGSYAVLVTDDLGGIVSAPATLIVLVRPTITVQPNDATVVEGGTARFYVEAIGTQPLGFRWLKSGVTFTNAIISNTATSSTLIITNVPLSYHGSVFRAGVSNMVAQTGSRQATLRVLKVPVLQVPVVRVDGGFQFVLNGSTNAAYRIEASSNLTDWWLLTTLTSSAPQTVIIDAVTNNSPRFYRARLELPTP